MFKNLIISVLAVFSLIQDKCYAEIVDPVTFVCLVVVFFVVLTEVEDEIEQIKRRRYRKKRFQKQLERAQRLDMPPVK